MLVKIRRASKGAVFTHPLDPAPRTAILAPGFRETRLVRVFPDGWNNLAQRFSPSSIAAPFDQFHAVARDRVMLDQALIVLTYSDGPELSEIDRDWLWQTFCVPIFEQHYDSNNRLLAAECEAHAGLHVVAGFERLALEEDVCACGNPAPRLLRGPRIDELASLLA